MAYAIMVSALLTAIIGSIIWVCAIAEPLPDDREQVPWEETR